MPYCTVPRCTSMTGKVKDVSFHQFPKDKERAILWNDILERGKPYTKHLKVCSLHFKAEDFKLSDGAKKKAQSKTLRKDAVPSQNLPHSRRHIIITKNRLKLPAANIDSQMQQVAQTIYMQTMLDVNATKVSDVSVDSKCNEQKSSPRTESSLSISSNSSGPFNESISQIEHLLYKNRINSEISEDYNNESPNMSCDNLKIDIKGFTSNQTFKCTDCSKCFKDPDVFFIHKRTHVPKNPDGMDAIRKTLPENVHYEIENWDNSAIKNSSSENSTEETLRANPILANLLKSIPPTLQRDDTQQEFDSKSVTSIEKQMMATTALNMKNYFRNLSSMMTQVVVLSNKSINEEIDNLVYGLANDNSRESCNSNLNDLVSEKNEEQGMQLDDENDSLDSEFD